MGFYGNVYYQLINNFYKSVANNSGKNSTNITPNNTLGSNLTVEAVGRAGVLNFDTGNKWINFSKDDNDVLTIAHGGPDSSAASTFDGFIKKSGLSEAEKKTATALQEGEYFEAFEGKYDKAGHISSINKKLYRLPVTNADDIKALQQALWGTGLNTVTMSNFPSVAETKKHLYGYVEKNSLDIKNINSYLGTWTGVCSNWSSHKPTVTSVIGNLDKLYDGESVKGYSGIKNNTTMNNLIGVFGSAPKLWSAFAKETTPISMVDSVLKLKADVEQELAIQKGQISLHTADLTNISQSVTQIGTRPDGYETVYTELGKMRALDLELDAKIAAEKARAEQGEAKVLQDAKDYADDIKKTLLGESDVLSGTYDTIKEIDKWIQTHDNTITIASVLTRLNAEEAATAAINSKLTLGTYIPEGETDAIQYENVQAYVETTKANVTNNLMSFITSHQTSIDTILPKITLGMYTPDGQEEAIEYATVKEYVSAIYDDLNQKISANSNTLLKLELGTYVKDGAETEYATVKDYVSAIYDDLNNKITLNTNKLILGTYIPEEGEPEVEYTTVKDYVSAIYDNLDEKIAANASKLTLGTYAPEEGGTEVEYATVQDYVNSLLLKIEELESRIESLENPGA